ncbi:hypothetical protein [Paenibacillus ginsengarvi]|uniref:Uncharacterized protein n=1 Tax=Paenibacillus ginsengarvi TaxID=400777 RepID=A0A3B0CLF8_9BACL|nr:hypothetical protein [Paenibacillus ginsengarvi]RKN85059.1 hypothetical protein D7M11_11115 [Paenibacillus ginsengarvi]
MGEERRKNAGSRELTYQVGWKKGKLKVGENGRVTSSESAVFFMEKKSWQRMLERYAWREAPLVPDKALGALLWASPAILFGLTWWGVYLLSRF